MGDGIMQHSSLLDLVANAVHDIDRVVDAHTHSHRDHWDDVDVNAHVGDAQVAVAEHRGEDHRQDHQPAGVCRVVVDRHHQKRCDQHEGRDHDTVMEVGLVDRSIDADDARRRLDREAVDAIAVKLGALLRALHCRLDRLGLQVRQVEAQIGKRLLGVDVLAQGSGYRTGIFEGVHQAADAARISGNLQPARIALVGQTVDPLHQVREAIGRAHHRLFEHVALEFLHGGHCLRPAQTLALAGAGHHEQLLAAGEALRDQVRRAVVVVVTLENR